MAKSDPKLLTQAEYSRSREARGLSGGSREAVRKAVAEGRISVFGPDRLVDQQLADLQWERNTRARATTKPASEPPADLAGTGGHATPDAVPAVAQAPAAAAPAPDTGYTAARARRELAEAEQSEIALAKLRGDLVLREDVDRAFREIGREIRDRLMAAARRTAAEVSSLTSAEACERVIDREHRVALELLTTSFREKLGAGPGGRSAA